MDVVLRLVRWLRQAVMRRWRPRLLPERIRRATVESPRYCVVVDFECTCERDVAYRHRANWIHEIIEFPAVCLDLRTLECVGEFHRFVRPTERPILTKFCVELTGIDQATVDAASTLEQVLDEFKRWLPEGGYFFACDGPADFRRFLITECLRKRLSPPAWRWCDVALHLRKVYDLRPCSLHDKLTHLGLEPAGRAHSGIDDARNIARLALKLVNDGHALAVNDAWADRTVAPPPRTPELRAEAARRRKQHLRAARPLLPTIDW